MMMEHFKKSMKRQISELMTSSQLNRKWITVGPAKVYMRNGVRSLDNKIVHTIEIANVEINKHNQRKGYFRAICDVTEELAAEHGRYVYHENVKDELRAFHQGRGYKAAGEPLSALFYKNFGDE